MDKYQICSSAVLHEPLRPIELRYSCRLVALLQHTRAFCSSPSLGVLPPSSVTVLEALLTRSHLSAANIPRGFFVFVVTLKKKKNWHHRVCHSALILPHLPAFRARLVSVGHAPPCSPAFTVSRCLAPCLGDPPEHTIWNMQPVRGSVACGKTEESYLTAGDKI